MRTAAGEGFINATDLADYLVSKGLAFRDAYKISGRIVSECIKRGCVLETLPIEDYKKFDPVFGPDVYDAIDLDKCVKRRTSFGGTAPLSVAAQIAAVRELIAE